jgi:methylenetetrahydrofolate reductase (NADPH)
LHTFRTALRTQDFTVTAELALDAGSDRASLLAQAGVFAPQVSAVQVPESIDQQVHLAPLAAAAILLDAGIDPVVHMICRDRNRVALRADLLGAEALGVTSLLLMRGKEFPARARAKQVYDWGTRRLITAAQRMAEADFLIGSVATVFKPDRDWKPENLPVKADVGVRFVQTQLCFDVELLRHYMARLVAEKLTRRVSVIVSVAPLPSAEMALWLGKNLRGSTVPARLVKRLRESSDPELEGIRICAELLREIAAVPGVSGANVTCLGQPEAVAEAIRLAGVRHKPADVRQP